MNEVLTRAVPDDLAVFPSVHYDSIRMFYHGGRWYIASETTLEEVVEPLGVMGQTVAACLTRHYRKGVFQFVCQLRTDRVWFFGIHGTERFVPFPSRRIPPRASAVILQIGTCNVLHHQTLLQNPYRETPDLPPL